MPTFFDAGEFVTTPYHPTTGAVTITVWVLWESGPGPLVKTADEAWRFLFESDGRCAYSLGDEVREIPLAVDEVRGRWAFFALAVEGDDAAVWIDEAPVDQWPNALVRPQQAGLVLMEDAVGSAVHFAVFQRRLSDDELRGLWTVGVDDPDLLARERPA